ncbi:HD domain-containing protein [Leptodontidium sp. MPI-SDFR-AT-0119]|nr:HD domain-containing protein [Leptodontidium sp. MPI-SDFR-AT-0119]
MTSLQAELHNTTLPYLHLMDVLKHLPRTGWLRTIEHPESVASHMYRMALIAMTAPKGLDRDKCIKLAISHDMGEALAGDLTPHDGVSKAEKFKLEEFGFKYIQSLLKKATDYEQQTFGEKDLDEFQGPYNAAKVLSPKGKEDLRLLTLEREAHFANRKAELPLVFLIGTPGSGEKVQAEALGKNAGFKVIDVEEIILEKSKDKDYIHQEFLAECIENSVRTPTVLLVGILEERIKAAAAGGQNWVVVVGFPDSLQQLNGFQRQVQKNTYTVMLKSENKPSTLSDKKYAAAVRDMAELEKYLGASGDYFKAVDASSPSESVTSKVQEAVDGFKQHSQRSK